MTPEPRYLISKDDRYTRLVYPPTYPDLTQAEYFAKRRSENTPEETYRVEDEHGKIISSWRKGERVNNGA